MNKEQFEKRYIERSGITQEQYDEFLITMPCSCGVRGCKGWVAVTNTPLGIKAHKDLYMIGDSNESN